jgi:hypothetical protein
LNFFKKSEHFLILNIFQKFQVWTFSRFKFFFKQIEHFRHWIFFSFEHFSSLNFFPDWVF